MGDKWAACKAGCDGDKVPAAEYAEAALAIISVRLFLLVRAQMPALRSFSHAKRRAAAPRSSGRWRGLRLWAASRCADGFTIDAIGKSIVG